MRKKSNEITLKDAIEQMLEVYRIKDKFLEENIKYHWEEIVGKMIAARTQEVYIKNQKLFLKVDSSVLRQELMMMRSNLVDKINEAAGKQIVTDVVLA